MLCGTCNKNKATVHLKQFVGEKIETVDLCEECAKQMDLNDPSGFTFEDYTRALSKRSSGPQRS